MIFPYKEKITISVALGITMVPVQFHKEAKKKKYLTTKGYKITQQPLSLKKLDQGFSGCSLTNFTQEQIQEDRSAALDERSLATPQSRARLSNRYMLTCSEASRNTSLTQCEREGHVFQFHLQAGNNIVDHLGVQNGQIQEMHRYFNQLKDTAGEVERSTKLGEGVI